LHGITERYAFATGTGYCVEEIFTTGYSVIAGSFDAGLSMRYQGVDRPELVLYAMQ
jgi:hypothetical protein